MTRYACYKPLYNNSYGGDSGSFVRNGENCFNGFESRFLRYFKCFMNSTWCLGHGVIMSWGNTCCKSIEVEFGVQESMTNFNILSDIRAGRGKRGWR